MKSKNVMLKLWLSKTDEIDALKHHKKNAWKTVENLETNSKSKKTKITDIKKYGETCAAA